MSINSKLYARYTYAMNRLARQPFAITKFASNAELINVITALEAEPDYADGVKAEPPHRAETDAMMGRIVGSLDKVQRARLRKLMNGKLVEGRWADMLLPINVLIAAGVRFEAAHA